MRDYVLKRDDALIVHDILRSEISAHKNWICGNVERGELQKAQELTRHMRTLERIAASLNVKVDEEIYKG